MKADRAAAKELSSCWNESGLQCDDSALDNLAAAHLEVCAELERLRELVILHLEVEKTKRDTPAPSGAYYLASVDSNKTEQALRDYLERTK